MDSLREKKAGRSAQRQALAEAEEMLVKCHALCDPTGLAAGDNDGAGGGDPTGEKCVIDCALTLTLALTLALGDHRGRPPSTQLCCYS